MAIHYLNTDLELVSELDLAALAAVLERWGLFALHVEYDQDHRRWQGRFEAVADHSEPEGHICAMLDIVESLGAADIRIWESCSMRDFNIGYASGDAPRVLEQGLSNHTLRRIADAGAKIVISIYAQQLGESD